MSNVQQNQLTLFDMLGAPGAPEQIEDPRVDHPETLIARRHRQLLVHSFLYYKLDDTLVDDPTYDRWYRELVSLHARYPAEAATAPYADICKTFLDSASGYAIKEYPPEIVSTAIHLLWQAKYRAEEDFETFCSRRGFVIKNQ